MADTSYTAQALSIVDRDFQDSIEKDVINLTSANIEKLIELAFKPINQNSIEDLEVQEKAFIKLANMYCKKMDDKGLLSLIPILRQYFSGNHKARTAKLIRVMLDLLLESNADRTEAIQLCCECIEWAKKDKKTFLCQIFETKLASFYYDTEEFNKAIELGDRLVADFKKMSYKDELIEILIIMCKIYFVMGNYQKCRAFLTSVRTTANTTHLSSKLQASIDLLSGSVHSKEDDYLTAYSYFYEAFELFDNVDCPLAIKALKYMLFCKIMLNRPDDVPTVLSGKLSLKYRSRELDAMRAVAVIFKNKSLDDMKSLLVEYDKELVHDPVVKVHLQNMHDALFENNLLMVIEPYSTVEIGHIAQLVKMDVNRVINRIARMILDGKLNATLDQGFGALEVFPYKEDDALYDKCIESLGRLSTVIESLKNRKAITVKS